MSQEYFVRVVSKQLRDLGADVTTINKWQNRIAISFSDNNLLELGETLADLRRQYNKFNGHELDQYLKTRATNKSQEQRKGRDPVQYEPYIEAQIEEILHGETFQLIKADVALDYDETKKLINSIIFDRFGAQKFEQKEIEEKLKLPFFITNSSEFVGNISSKRYQSKQSIPLISFWNTPFGYALSFFGSTVDKRKWYAFKEYFSQFWVYRFNSDNGQSMILLSKDELSMQHCKIRGMMVDMRDSNKLGESARIPTNFPIVFVYDTKPDIIPLTKEEFEALRKRLNLSHDSLTEMTFGVFRHPIFFEKMLFAWLFSGKFSGYPLHVGWLGLAAGGKSKIDNCLSLHFGEPVFGGGTSTLKGLVPNYGGQMADEGYLCVRNRLGIVDEFFAVYRRASSANFNMDSGLDMLQEILEHQVRLSKSGKGEMGVMELAPKMKVLFTTNTKHYYKLTNILEMAQNMNNAFLSRILWYVQTREHKRFIDERKARYQTQSEIYPQRSTDLVMLFDYFNAISLQTDGSQIERIQNKYIQFIPPELEQVYIGRATHHIACLIDGMAKYNYLIGKKDALEIIQADIDDAESLFASIILSWKENIELDMKHLLSAEGIPPGSRLDYLPGETQAIFREIEKNLGCSEKDLEAKFGAGVYLQLGELKRYEIIKESADPLFGTGLFPYWSKGSKKE